MNRREFILALGGAAAAWPLAARGQQPERVRRLGVLMGYAENDPQAQAQITAFRQGLQRLGWTGRNLRIAYRWGQGELDRARTVARELIALQPEAVLAASPPAVKALSGETRPVRFLSYEWVTRSAMGWSTAWRAPAAMSPGSALTKSRSQESGFNC